MNKSEKLQKVLARAGIGSRRQIEIWISAGKIIVNNQVAHVGQRVLPTDKIKAHGRVISLAKSAVTKPRVLLYHKLAGEVCTRHDEQDRDTVFAKLPRLYDGRWIMIGRLDINTMGLLLFTNHGDLAHRLMHPSYEIEREYAVRVFGNVDQEILKRLQQGVMLDDGKAKFDKITDAGGTGMNHWFHVILHEGRNREVRRLWESQGVKVSRLTRVRFGNIMLPRSLRQGRYLELSPSEVSALGKAVDLRLL